MIDLALRSKMKIKSISMRFFELWSNRVIAYQTRMREIGPVSKTVQNRVLAHDSAKENIKEKIDILYHF